MKDILTYNEEIETLLTEVLSIVESLNDNDFDKQLSGAQEKIEKAKLLKKEVEEGFTKEETALFREILTILTKQIEKKFDNKIKEKNLEKDRIGRKIEQLKNNKKLQNYRR